MKVKRLLYLGVMTLLTSSFLLGCQNEKDSDSSKEKVSQTQKKEETKKTLAELGFTIYSYDSIFLKVMM